VDSRIKQVLAAIVAAGVSCGCTAADEKKAECAPAPKELVKKDLEAGSGTEVVFRSGVLASYTGWFYDGCAKDLKGAQFDSNADKPAPFGFMVGAGRVIKGWDEGVLGMKKGGKRLLVIPSDKAYGPEGRPPRIPANAPLVFEVSIVDIVYDPAKAAADKAAADKKK
jgi:FKBP-type peptidyl-prolyl cis-trans isomerase FkpA